MRISFSIRNLINIKFAHHIEKIYFVNNFPAMRVQSKNAGGAGWKIGMGNSFKG